MNMQQMQTDSQEWTALGKWQICASLTLDFVMRRPPWGGLSTFEWSEDSGRLQSG